MAKFLIVEDEFFIRQTAEDTIRDRGHCVLLAGDVSEALSHLSTPQHIDGLFVDMRLGSAANGGCEIANQAVKDRPNLRVLYTSGSELSADMRQLFVGGGRFLQKPYSPMQLDTAVGELLGDLTEALS